MPIPANPLNEAPKTARQRIYMALRDWIIDGTLRPGEKISDLEISQYFSVSRTPVREAIQQLADQKLIEVYPGRESRIAPIDAEKAHQIYRILAELHAMAVEFSFSKITPEVIEELEKINNQLFIGEENVSLTDMQALDKEFHSVFLRLADNDFLKDFTEILRIHVDRAEKLYYSMEREYISSAQEHGEIISALKEGNLEKAKEKVCQNWIHAIEVVNSQREP